MRKQLAIGVSMLALTALGGVSESDFILINQQGADSQYTHLVKTSLNQFEPMSGASLPLGLPNRHSIQTASVQFITGGDNIDFGNMDFTDPTIEQCKQNGYTLTSCDAGLLKGLKCPYNSAYFDKCCDASYKYNSSECASPKTLSSDSCGGKYKCYCDRALYPVESCSSPQVTSGGSCTEEGKTYYEKCVCPAYFDKTCEGQNLQGGGEGCTQDGVTKYTSCECKSGYNMTCSDVGPVAPTDYCQMNGIKYYNNCKTCENKCSLDSCPEGVVCEYEDCSQKYCDIGCEVGYTNWCTKPETNCTTLGYTKTEADCSGTNAIKCPYDTSKVFCKNIKNCNKIGDVLYEDGLCAVNPSNIDLNRIPIGIVFDTINRLAIALTDTQTGGSVGSQSMKWSSGSCDTPNLENCMVTDEINECATDGRFNTLAIINTNGGCGGITSAANAAYAYKPKNCKATFCQRGKWFLPSARDLNNIFNSKSILNNSLSLLSQNGATQLSKPYYWSSNEYNKGNAWYFHVSMNKITWLSKGNDYAYYVRPIMSY